MEAPTVGQNRKNTIKQKVVKKTCMPKRTICKKQMNQSCEKWAQHYCL
jgi:hypothetical protein